VACVLALVCGTVLAQGRGQGKEQGGRPADRRVKADKPAQTPKADVNAPAAEKKKTAEDIQKEAQEKVNAAKQRGQEQAQTQGKAAKDQAAEKVAQAKGKAHEQQMLALEKQTRHEAAKHMERQARLARIRELAVQKGDQKMIARVDELIAKEKQVYDRKFQQIQTQKRLGGVLPPGGTALPKAGGKDRDKADVNKPAERPAPEKAEEPAPPAAGASNEPKPQ